ncbi:MAG: hypothetical protein MJZ20_06870 [Bacteroidaceae bacterium]|nr:hypothetical protein [Bacteroidaceae bacterium]
MFDRERKEKKIYRVVVEDENGSAVLEDEYYSDEDEETAAIDALEHVLSRHR